MRPYKNNHKRQKFRSNGDRSINRNLENQSLVSNNGFQRKNHRNNNQNASRLVEKYNNLAREALSSGDKILSENYFQHADHFTRIQVENDNYKKNKFSQSEDKSTVSSEGSLVNSDEKDNKDNYSEDGSTKVSKISTEVN